MRENGGKMKKIPYDERMKRHCSDCEYGDESMGLCFKCGNLRPPEFTPCSKFMWNDSPEFAERKRRGINNHTRKHKEEAKGQQSFEW